MRKQLLSLLCCPSCGSCNLGLETEHEEAQEIRHGMVLCPSCSARYAIVDGVAELLAPLDEDTLRERVARNRQRDWDIERKRPFIEDVPGFPWIWPGVAANVLQGMEQLNLKGARVLDLGPGTCWSTRMLCERGANAVALDISTDMLCDGEAQFGGVFFDRIAATMQTIPFQNQSFDAVFASASIHHTSDLGRTFAEIARVLRPGGKVVLVNEPVCGALNNGKNFGRQEREQGMNEHIYYLRDYLASARKSGIVPLVLFPAALDGQLRGDLPAPPGWRFRLARHLFGHLPTKLRHLSLIPANLVSGSTLILIGYKV